MALPRPLLFLGLAGVIALVAVLLLYGVIGPRSTPPSLVNLPPADVSGVIKPRKENGPLHVLLVGTSLTSGGDWPERLEHALASCAPRGITVERLAKAGAGIRWGLPALKTRLSATSLARPDIVIAEFSGNDASLRHGLPLFLARKRTLLLIETIQRAGSIAFLSTMSPGWDTKAITRLGQARYHSMYRDVTAETGTGLIDTAPQWRALPTEIRYRVVPDSGHPNAEGAALITLPAFLAALKPLVCGRI